MSEFLGDIDTGREHQSAERDARDPGDEADEGEDGEDQKDDSSAVVFAHKHVDGSDEAEDDVQDTGGPDEGLWEQSRQPDVGVTQEESACETEDEEDESVCVETEVVAAIVDSTSVEAFGRSCDV